MYCKKCGTEQHDGQKFCPKCGEPFLDENGKPYLKGFKKDMLDAKEKMASKVDELTQQGKSLVNEKIQPQLDEKLNEFKEVNWTEKKTSVLSYINNPDKVGQLTKIIACLFIFWFFIKIGFSVSFIYYMIIAAIALIAFMGIPKLQKGLKSRYISLATCAVLMLIIVLGGLKGSGNEIGTDSSDTDSVQKDFMESLSNPSTAYAVRIDKKYAGMLWAEVEEGLGSKDGSFIWTLIFFPENETKTRGRATLEAWLIDKSAWADALTKTYCYEIRNGVVELYKGYNKPTIYKGWSQCDDMRLYIEGKDGTIQLRGNFARKDRIFKQTTYTAANQKEKHYYMR